MRGIALNFLALKSDDFRIRVYRFPFIEGRRPIVGQEHAVRRYFPNIDGGEYFWTTFRCHEDGIETLCRPFDNVYVTLDAMMMAIIERCQNSLDASQYSVIGGYRKRVEITVQEFREGSQIISVEPYLLRLSGQFGILAEFRFHPNEDYIGTQKALQLSLSLDKNGKRNMNSYADRYSKIASFVSRFHRNLSPLPIAGGSEVNIDRRFVELSVSTLDRKRYVVGSDQESRSQFMGIKHSGPYRGSKKTHFYFLYRPQDRYLSRDLFRALRGDTFATFPGMEKMFHVPITKENVSGVPLASFGSEDIERTRDMVLDDSKDRNIVAVVLTPFSRHDKPEENKHYWIMKHAFLSKGIPIQVVSNETVSNTSKLKWSTSSIGLQIFAKAGGIPWRVQPRTARCLIVGIGQAHRLSDGRVERFFAYSVLTDSSGSFEEVRVLADATEEDHYIRSFSESLSKIFSDYASRFSSFVVHATFSIRGRELDCVAVALELQKERQTEAGEFVALKFNDRNSFFGFSIDHNSRVPYESTVMALSKRDYLVWFEGLQYGSPTLRDMVGGPVHVSFTYPREIIPIQHQRAHLQDAINLSGANWRGFSAKSLPISVYYANIIARYLKEFDNYGLRRVDVGILTPWFL